MKTLKKLLIPILLLMLIVTFAACGDDEKKPVTPDEQSVKDDSKNKDDDENNPQSQNDDEDNPQSQSGDGQISANANGIVGTWGMTFDALKDQDLGEDFAGFDGKLEMKFLFKFDSDGTYIISVDEDEAAKVLGEFLESLMVFIKEMVAEQSGVSYETFLEIYEQQNGDSFEEAMKEELESEMNLDDLLDEIGNFSGRYKVDGDKLYTTEGDEEFDDDVYKIFKITDKTLTFESTTDPDYEESSTPFKLPLELTKES